MTYEFIAILIAGAAAGGFVNGLAGFGTSLFALPWWLVILPPQQAVALVLAMAVASGVQGTIAIRHSINPRKLAVFLIPALVGIPFGLQILEHINPTMLKITIGCFMLAYGGFFIVRKDLPSIQKPTKLIDGSIGFVSGILGAVAGLSGAIPTMWLAMRDWPKQVSRGILQPFNMAVLCISAIMLAIGGAYDRTVLITMVIALPTSIIAARIGLIVFRRLTDFQFRRLLIALMFISGIAVLIRELM